MPDRRRRLLVRALAALAFALTGAVAGTIARATIVVRASVEEMSTLCRTCVVGTVTGEVVTLDRAKSAITTTWTLRVDETWVGAPAGEVTVSAPGGRVGTLSQEICGGARLAKGERVVAFLWKNNDGRLEVLGEAQGCFHVRRDERVGEDVCENSTAGLSLVDRSGKAASADTSTFTMTEMRRRVAVARQAREDREKAAREARATRLAEMRVRAERLAEETRDRPGGAPK